LATVLASTTDRAPLGAMSSATRERARTLAAVGAALVFAQSLLGALVRHMDAGMACPDVPLCLGRVVPPLVNAPITVHFAHRVMAIVVAAFVLGAAAWLRSAGTPEPVQRWAAVVALLVTAQIVLGVLSVTSVLAVVPVAAHTVVAAGLLATLVHLATTAHRSPVEISNDPARARGVPTP
jgi:cytochrome c oxidase assembly protein subunit 15